MNTENYTTAIYPNRIIDKDKVERLYKLNEHGDNTTEFFTKKGTLIAKGYTRIVYGDHGPYIEFDKKNIIASLISKFSSPPPPTSYYEWFTIKDGSFIKIYDQLKDVKSIPFAPKGGHREYRKEGYADYKPGMIYISPFEIQLSHTLEKQLSL